MQFHHHGYVSGDPRVQLASGVDRPDELSDIVTRIVERRGGRLEIGQADGTQARSVETFDAFGFAERITAEAYRITEMAFWKSDPRDPSRIVRAARAVDDPTGISEYPICSSTRRGCWTTSQK